MGFTYTDKDKIILEAWGKFKVTLEEAVEPGDLLSWYNGASDNSVRHADDSDSRRANCIAMEKGAADAEIWACLKAVCKTISTIATGGVVTRVYFAESTDYLGAPLYLGEAGKPESDEGGTYVQKVGRLLARDTILLEPDFDLDTLIGGKWKFASWGTVVDSGSLYMRADYSAYINSQSAGHIEVVATTGVRLYVGGVGLNVAKVGVGALVSTSGRMQAGSFRLTGNGSMILGQHSDPVTPPTDEGSIWYNTTQDKLQFKTGAGFETVTSA